MRQCPLCGMYQTYDRRRILHVLDWLKRMAKSVTGAIPIDFDNNLSESFTARPNYRSRVRARVPVQSGVNSLRAQR